MRRQPADKLDQDEFATLFRRAAPTLWCVAAAVLGAPDGAEDVVQDAACQALGKLDSFRVGTDFSAWMAKIVRYSAMNQRRRQTKGPRPLDEAVPAPLANPAPVVSEHGALLPDQAGFDDRVQRGLGKLGEIERACLLLKVVLDRSYKEIAEVLELPENTAMSHVHRARQRLVEQLQPAKAREAR